jgi:hypothetical protein
MVAVDAVIVEVLSCNNASMRHSFKGENLPICQRIRMTVRMSVDGGERK